MRPLTSPLDYGVDELVREAADSNRSFLNASATIGLGEVGSTSFPKFREYTRGTRPAETAIVSVRDLRRFGFGWDGYHAEPARDSSVQDATDFLSRTQSEANFGVDLDADGTVVLAVSGRMTRVVLTFEGFGRVSISTESDGTWSDGGDYLIRAGLGRADQQVEGILAQA